MNTFLKNGWIQKLIIAIIIVLLFNFIYPNYVQADFIDSVLLDPIVSLVALIGDGFMWVTQWFLFDTTEVIINTNETAAWWQKAITVVVGAAAFIAVGIMTGGVGWALMAGAGAAIAANAIAVEALPDNFELPIFYFSPLEIFANSIPLLDANFFNPTKYEAASGVSGAGDITQQESTAQVLQGVVSSVYQSLRIFSLVVLLSILVYVAIRIITSSTGQDKAKYKSMLFNWLVAICLLFILHYIMVFSMTIAEKISEILIANNALYTVEMPEVNTDNELVKAQQQNGKLTWMTTYAGKARIEMQLGEVRDLTGLNIKLNKVGWVLIYIMLTFYTAYFFVVYLKRVIYLAFLTMIAPLICMMYPIDKIKDGQSQTFDMWLKEYIFNVLLQPLHLLIYTILIGAAGELATENIIYSVVAIGFIIPAEKFFRKMFGFDKASTTGEAGSFAAGALAAQGLNNLMKLAKPKSDSDKDKNKNKDESNDNNNLRTQDTPELDSGDNSRDNRSDDDSEYDYWGRDDNNNTDDNYENNEMEDDYYDNQQAMADAYNENYGTSDYNPLVAAALAADAVPNGDDNRNTGPQWTREEMQEMGMDDESIDQYMDSFNENENEDEGEDKESSEERTSERRNIDDGSGRIQEQTKGQRAWQYVKDSAKGRNKTGKALRVGGKYLGKNAGKVFKGVGKAYFGAIAGGALGLIGLAAGIADGKPGNTLKNTAAGLGAGYLGATGLIARGEKATKKVKSGIQTATNDYKQEVYGTTDKKDIKQIKASTKALKNFEKTYRDSFNADFGRNSQRYMDIAKERIAAGASEEDTINHIKMRNDQYERFSGMTHSELQNKYGTTDIEKLEDGYMRYIDSGISDEGIIDSAMQLEHSGIDYEGVSGTVHKNVSENEAMAAAAENQKIKDNTRDREDKKYATEAYMQNKRSRNIEKAMGSGADRATAEAFANRSEAATKKVMKLDEENKDKPRNTIRKNTSNVDGVLAERKKADEEKQKLGEGKRTKKKRANTEKLDAGSDNSEEKKDN